MRGRSLVPVPGVVGGTAAVSRYQDHVAHSFTLRSDIHSRKSEYVLYHIFFKSSISLILMICSDK